MSISPWYQNQTYPPLQATIQDDNGNIVNLTGATLSTIIYNAQAGTSRAGAGTWTITNPTAGVATYTWNVADSSQTGTFSLFLKIIMPAGAGTLICDPVSWEIFST